VRWVDKFVVPVDVRGEGASSSPQTSRVIGRLASGCATCPEEAEAVFNEVKAVPLGGNVFRFTAIGAGEPFRLYDSRGNLLLRDRGVIRFSLVFDTLGDATPGGVVVEELEPSVRGPHPGFDDETLCPVLVPLLAGP
jgi:hypothetical protein